YHFPRASNILHYVLSRSKSFVQKAGTIIFASGVIHLPVKIGDEPNDNARSKDDRSSLLNKALTETPNIVQDIACTRKMICWKFHYKWLRWSSKHAGLL